MPPPHRRPERSSSLRNARILEHGTDREDADSVRAGWRIAKRGRKRWLGLVFVTQLPQHLPPQVLGLVNSYVLHKITDPHVISTLRKTVSGIDESLWNRLSGLAPGQAVVSFPHMARPLLVSIDPTPAELRMVD